MKAFVEVAKALSDESRVRVLVALRGHELCVCQIVELLELAPSTVSKHMSVLRHAGLVDSRKNGRWVYYKRAENVGGATGKALSWMDASLTDASRSKHDGERLREILKVPPEELCRRMKMS